MPYFFANDIFILGLYTFVKSFGRGLLKSGGYTGAGIKYETFLNQTGLPKYRIGLNTKSFKT